MASSIVQLQNVENNDILYPVTTTDAVTGLSTVGKTGTYSSLTGKPSIIINKISAASYLSAIAQQSVQSMRDSDNHSCIIYQNANNVVPEFYDGTTHYYCIEINDILSMTDRVGTMFDISIHFAPLQYSSSPALFLCNIASADDLTGTFMTASSNYTVTRLSNPFAFKTDGTGRLLPVNGPGNPFATPFGRVVIGIKIPMTNTGTNPVSYSVNNLHVSPLGSGYFLLQ